MMMVARGLMQNPIPMHETSHCGVLELFAGNVLLAGFTTISLSVALVSKPKPLKRRSFSKRPF